MTAIENLMANAKAKREAAGLKSTYTGRSGQPFDMYHPNQAAKAFNDFKFALRAAYPTDADVPAADLARLNSLHAAMRAATWRNNR